jgi:glutaredoxin 3
LTVDVKIYTRAGCGYCTAAIDLLEAKGIAYEEIDLTGNTEGRRWLAEASGRSTVPQIFIDGRPIGGYTDLHDLDIAGELDAMLAGSPEASGLKPEAS